MPDTTGMKKDSGDLDEEFDIDFKKQCSVMWTSQHFYPAYVSTHAQNLRLLQLKVMLVVEEFIPHACE